MEFLLGPDDVLLLELVLHDDFIDGLNWLGLPWMQLDVVDVKLVYIFLNVVVDPLHQ